MKKNYLFSILNTSAFIICSNFTNAFCQTLSVNVENELIGHWLSWQEEAYSILFNYEQGFTLRNNNKYCNIIRTTEGVITVNEEELGEWHYKKGNKDTLQFIRNAVLNFEILQLNDSVLEIRDFGFPDNHYVLQRYSAVTSSNVLAGSASYLDYTVFPNPSNGLLKISFNEIYNSRLVSIYNLQGGIIYNGLHSEKDLFIDLMNQKKGIYLVEIQTGSSSETSRVVIK